MDPILSSQVNAWYTDAVTGARADAAASATEAKTILEQTCVGQPKGVNVNNLLQRAIAVAKARAEAARAKANAAKAVMDNNIAALTDAQTYLAQCEEAVVAAEQKLAEDQAEYERVTASIPALEQNVPNVVVSTVTTAYENYINSLVSEQAPTAMAMQSLAASSSGVILTSDQQDVYDTFRGILDDITKSVPLRIHEALDIINSVEQMHRSDWVDFLAVLKNTLDAFVMASNMTDVSMSTVDGQMLTAQQLFSSSESLVQTTLGNLNQEEGGLIIAQNDYDAAGGEAAFLEISTQIDVLNQSYAYTNWEFEKSQLMIRLTDEILATGGFTKDEVTNLFATRILTQPTFESAMDEYRILIGDRFSPRIPETYAFVYLNAYYNAKPVLEQISFLLSRLDELTYLRSKLEEETSTYNHAVDSFVEAQRRYAAYTPMYTPTNTNYVLAITALTEATNTVQALSNKIIPTDQSSLVVAQSNLVAAQSVDFTALQTAVTVSTQTYTQLNTTALRTEGVLSTLQSLADKISGIFGGVSSQYLPKAKVMPDIRGRI